MSEQKDYRVYFSKVNATYYDIKAYGPQAAATIATRIWRREHMEPMEPRVGKIQ